jgi:acyl-CoA reductase-like NAD-dependent aldehyde dehydrogenase
VFDDCEWAQVIQVAVRGAFLNCGQNCISAERFYVHSAVYERFLAEAAALVAQLRQGDSSASGGPRCDIGAITMAPQLRNVEELVADAVLKGARVVCGAKRAASSALASGLFYEPTILGDVTHAMRIANEEAFGPVMSVIKFDSEEHLLKMVNSTEYGLGSSLFTRDYARAQRVQRALQSGMVVVNDFAMVPTVQSLPFGGVKSSGFGAFNGPEGLRAFCATKSVVTDRFPVRTYAPKFLQYPMPKQTPEIVKEAMKMVYGDGYLQSAAALARMLKHLIASTRSDSADAELKQKAA